MAETNFNHRDEPEEYYDDDLTNFLNHFLKKGCPIGYIPLFNAVHKIEDITSIIWYRHEQYQIQLFVVPPNYVIPEHAHINVDSYEVYLGGQVYFTLNGKYYAKENERLNIDGNPDEFNLPRFRGLTIRVRPNVKHGGVFGPHGAVFMSVQKWLNGIKPHCVALDYEGLAIGKDHASKIKCGNFFVKEELTERDALGI